MANHKPSCAVFDPISGHCDCKVVRTALEKQAESAGVGAVDEQAAFESWCAPLWHINTFPDGTYENDGAYAAWKAWQARAALAQRAGSGEAKPVDADVAQIVAEVNEACANWPPFNSAHEGFAVLKEEVDELWDEVKVNQKRRDLTKMKKEAKQVAAMALRFMRECCDEITGRK